MTDPLEAFQARAEREPFFLASLLADLARSENLDDAALAAALGCKPEDLLMIRLCRAPRTDAPGFRQDIDDICAAFGADPIRLAEVVKRARVVQRFQPADDDSARLMAARDREEPEEQKP